MSEVPTPDPHEHWIDSELRELPSERGPRRKRGAKVAFIALIVSIVLHLSALSGCVGLLLFLMPLRSPPPPPPPPESMPTFVVPTPAPSPPIPPPETNQISDRDTQANSPGDGKPQAAGGAVPSEGGTPVPNEPPPGEPAPPKEPPPPKEPREKPPSDMQPNLHPLPPEPEPESPEARRERLSQALRGMGGRGTDWGSLAAPGDGGQPSSGLGYSYGDSGFQIESKADVDWGPWSRKVQGIVRNNWYSVIPVAARVGMKGIVRVRFVVHRDGTLTDFELLDSAGLLPLDQAVQTALVNLSNPLPPLPLRDTDEDTIRITYTFLYNLSDERERRAWERQRWLDQKRQQGGG